MLGAPLVSRLPRIAAPSKRLLTAAEAAGYCGMSEGSFARLCPVKPISFGQCEKLRRFDVVALDCWIDRLTRGESTVVSREAALAALDE
jgi:hypothetical protein